MSAGTMYATNAQAGEAIALLDRLAARRQAVPADWYVPHHTCERSPLLAEDVVFDRKGLPSGQLQFHQSTHPARIMAPGNRWGGTVSMACEVDAWCRHTNRWQQTPTGPVQIIWFAPMYKQFEILRQQLTEFAFGRIPKYFASGKREGFVWPDGSQVFLGSYDSDWMSWQGIEPHLVVFDEQPPPPLWREMRARRSTAKRMTRYICKATQTDGWSWMADEIYQPWLDFHAKLGMNEEDALREQRHLFFWVWSKGGVHDNQAVPDEVLREKEAEYWPTRKERKVRLYGGFERLSGHCVFDEAALDFQRTQIAEYLKSNKPRVGVLGVKAKEAA